jgi:hypothetical protein
MKGEKPATIRRDFALWFAVLGPPNAWLLQFGANYALASWACAHHERWILPAVAVASLLPIAAAAVISFWKLKHPKLPRGDDEPLRDLQGRLHFMAKLGLYLSAIFFLVIVAQVVAMWFFPPCVE